MGTQGDNHYGFTTSDPGALQDKSAIQHWIDAESLWVYDKRRNVSGVCSHAGLTEIIRSFGHLSGENNYNKRIFLDAKLVRYTEDSITLDLRTDTFAKDQIW